jgi:hypothetical protein
VFWDLSAGRLGYLTEKNTTRLYTIQRESRETDEDGYRLIENRSGYFAVITHFGCFNITSVGRQYSISRISPSVSNVARSMGLAMGDEFGTLSAK